MSKKKVKEADDIADGEQPEPTDPHEDRRQRIIEWMYQHGFPIHDPDMLESMVQYVDYKDRFRSVMGRPTEYHPSLCKYAIEMGERGYSLKQIASVFSVTYSTLWNWGRAHPDFFEALARAREGAQAYWEMVGQAGIIGKGFNFPVWNKIVSSRFRSDYTDRKGLPYDPNEPETVMGPGEMLELDPRDLTEEQKKVLRIAIAKATKQET